MDPAFAIEADHLSKCYTLRHARKDENGMETHELWALKDVSFRIRKGTTVGIIGPNGSGKSTLLQILSGVTKPTSGTVKIRGKVASILDIGAGFHQELSGRENIYLNGQLHGFKRSEIKARFDEIVAFSGIGKFIDEPVKNYSSGMYLRLAFSIMANLDFDVYLLDEVMSVGDAEFMFKAREKIQELYRTSKTIVFVSHNLSELQNQQLYFLLEYGVLREVTERKGLLNDYLEHRLNALEVPVSTKNQEITDLSRYPGSPELIVRKISFNQESDFFRSDLAFTVGIEYEKMTDEDTFDVLLNISDYQDNIILSSSPFVSGDFSSEKPAGRYRYACTIPPHTFNAQVYKLSFFFLKNSSQGLYSVETSEVRNLKQQATVEIPLRLTNVILFKPAFFKNGQPMDFSLLNLSGRLLSGFSWVQDQPHF